MRAARSVAAARPFLQSLTPVTVGSNSGDDYGGSWEDTYIDAGSTTSNFDTTDPLYVDRASPIRRLLMRCDLSAVSGSARVRLSRIFSRVTELGVADFTVGMWLMNRNWVIDQVTWNIYSTGNNWGSAGGDDDTDVVEDSEGRHSAAVARSAKFPYDGMAVNNWHCWSAGMFNVWTQEAIDGAGQAAKGVNWLDFLLYWQGGGSEWKINSEEATDGQRPYLEIQYDTAAAPLDFTPISTGVLDGNGVDLSGDGDYPISIDIHGATRTAYDIGAYAFAQTHEDAAVDSLTLGDTTVGELTMDQAVADGLSLQDVAAARADFTRAAVDSLVLQDVADPALIMPEAAVDSLVLQDAVTSELKKQVAVAEGLVRHDSPRVVHHHWGVLSWIRFP